VKVESTDVNGFGNQKMAGQNNVVPAGSVFVNWRLNLQYKIPE